MRRTRAIRSQDPLDAEILSVFRAKASDSKLADQRSKKADMNAGTICACARSSDVNKMGPCVEPSVFVRLDEESVNSAFVAGMVRRGRGHQKSCYLCGRIRGSFIKSAFNSSSWRTGAGAAYFV